MRYGRRYQKKEPSLPEVSPPKPLDYKLSETVRIDLKESFDYFDKEKKGYITRDNIKSIMGNFGWFNCASAELEKAIDALYPSNPTDLKNDFSMNEVPSITILNP